MTLLANARIAGVTYLVYLAAGMSSLAVSGRGVGLVFNLLESFSALVLAVTLFAITREQDADIALLAMLCRVVEAVPGEGFIYAAVGNLLFCWLLRRGRLVPSVLASSGFLASSLLVIMLVTQRAGGATATNWSSPITWMMALPMLLFQLAFAAWLLSKGVSRQPQGARV